MDTWQNIWDMLDLRTRVQTRIIYYNIINYRRILVSPQFLHSTAILFDIFPSQSLCVYMSYSIQSSYRFFVKYLNIIYKVSTEIRSWEFIYNFSTIKSPIIEFGLMYFQTAKKQSHNIYRNSTYDFPFFFHVYSGFQKAFLGRRHFRVSVIFQTRLENFMALLTRNPSSHIRNVI